MQSELIQCGEQTGSDLVNYLVLDNEMSVPVMLVGDLNIPEDDWKKLKEYLPENFDLEFPAELFILSGSCIELLLSRYINLSCDP